MSHQQEARAREDFNRASRYNKPLAATAEQDGLAGEYALAHLLGNRGYHPPVRRRTPGWQMVHQGCWKMKVTTSRKAFSLLVKEGKVAADVYVLASITGEPEEQNVTFVGWASRTDVLNAPVRVMTRRNGQRTTDYELASHVIPRRELRPMIELAQILGFPPDNLDAPVREEQAPPRPHMGRLL